MKRIKKLTASLLALAITCAGINSIPASAIYTSNTFYTYGAINYSAVAAVNFIQRYSYTATTYSKWERITSRNVEAIAYCGVSIFQPTPGFSRNSIATTTLALPNGVIQEFDSSHWITNDYYSEPRVFGNYYYSLK